MNFQNDKNTDQKRKGELLCEQLSEFRNRRRNWESHWQECYNYSLPQRESFSLSADGGKKMTNIYDATAMNAVDQLAASLLGELTPPWSRWFTLKPGTDLSGEEAERIAPALEKASQKIQDHFDRSNFAVEMHQSFLDLVVAGTASLVFEEAPVGDFSAFQFTATPLSQIYLQEGERGRLDHTFREVSLTREQIIARFGIENLPQNMQENGGKKDRQNKEAKTTIIEAAIPKEQGFEYWAMLKEGSDLHILQHAILAKSPGEVYERSPVMRALPDITKGATHYHTKTVSPKWAQGQKPVTEIGSHIFYCLEA